MDVNDRIGTLNSRRREGNLRLIMLKADELPNILMVCASESLFPLHGAGSTTSKSTLSNKQHTPQSRTINPLQLTSEDVQSLISFTLQISLRSLSYSSTDVSTERNGINLSSSNSCLRVHTSNVNLDINRNYLLKYHHGSVVLSINHTVCPIAITKSKSPNKYHLRGV